VVVVNRVLDDHHVPVDARTAMVTHEPRMHDDKRIMLAMVMRRHCHDHPNQSKHC
jgi:hypothetical protein